MGRELLYTTDPYELHTDDESVDLFVHEEEMMLGDFEHVFEAMVNRYGTLVLVGEIHAWDGVHRTAFVARDFDEMQRIIWDSRWVLDVSAYIDGDALVIEQHHHDGTNVWTVAAVSAKGRKWLGNRTVGDYGANTLGNHLAFTPGYTKAAGIVQGMDA